MTKTRAIRRGDTVRIVGEHQDAGKTGYVLDVLPADRNYDRRARVQISSAYAPIIAMRLLSHEND
jgi:hypothetical protein